MKIGEDKATANERLDDQGLAVPMPPQTKSHAEETAIEMAEVVLRDNPPAEQPAADKEKHELKNLVLQEGEQPILGDDQTIETVQPTVSEVNSQPPAEEPSANKEKEEFKNMVLDEDGKPILEGEKE